MQSALLDKTLELLKDRPRSLTLEQIEADTELKVNWLKHLGKGKDNHSVAKVERLYVYLSGKQLSL